jgi:hypothetical protein
VAPSLKSSGWLATTNWIEGPGASGGSRFLPILFFAKVGSSGDAMLRDSMRRGKGALGSTGSSALRLQNVNGSSSCLHEVSGDEDIYYRHE